MKAKAMQGESTAPKQQFMDVEVVPGTRTETPIVIGATPKLYGIDQFTEKDYPEKARFCKDGMHFQLGKDFYVNAGTMQEVSPGMQCGQKCSMCCSASLPCSGNFTATSRYSSLYIKLDTSAAKPDEIVFEDQWDHGLDWKCCAKTTTDDYKILIKKNGSVMGGIKFRQEGFRQKCACLLQGLEGQEGGNMEQFAWAFKGRNLLDRPRNSLAPSFGPGFQHRNAVNFGH